MKELFWRLTNLFTPLQRLLYSLSSLVFLKYRDDRIHVYIRFGWMPLTVYTWPYECTTGTTIEYVHTIWNVYAYSWDIEWFAISNHIRQTGIRVPHHCSHSKHKLDRSVCQSSDHSTNVCHSKGIIYAFWQICDNPYGNWIQVSWVRPLHAPGQQMNKRGISYGTQRD